MIRRIAQPVIEFALGDRLNGHHVRAGWLVPLVGLVLLPLLFAYLFTGFPESGTIGDKERQSFEEAAQEGELNPLIEAAEWPVSSDPSSTANTGNEGPTETADLREELTREVLAAIDQTALSQSSDSATDPAFASSSATLAHSDWTNQYICRVEGWGDHASVIRKLVRWGYGDCHFGYRFAAYFPGLLDFGPILTPVIVLGVLIFLLLCFRWAWKLYRLRAPYQWLYESRTLAG